MFSEVWGVELFFQMEEIVSLKVSKHEFTAYVQVQGQQYENSKPEKIIQKP